MANSVGVDTPVEDAVRVDKGASRDRNLAQGGAEVLLEKYYTITKPSSILNLSDPVVDAWHLHIL